MDVFFCPFLEFHVFELPKFTKKASELRSRLDVWLYFLRHAAMMDMEALPAALQDPLVVRALEELKMLKQADPERERYESRRKAQLDDQTRLKVARMEGREEGRQEGLIQGEIGKIHFCESLLNRPETPSSELARRPLDTLTRMAVELQEEVTKRTKRNGQ
jgi:predicted transposase/invertase (TIGR01784 family)